MRVLFATAELAPAVRVGGLAEATAGLAHALRTQGVEVEIVLPDYGGVALDGEVESPLAGPAWAGELRARSGMLDGLPLTLVGAPGLARPHPYNDPVTGLGWADNDARFFAFAAGVAAVAAARAPDVLHLHDWHTAATLGLLYPRPPAVLTIHTMGYQGHTDASWLARLPHFSERYEWGGGCNPLAGALALADAVVAVSPTYAREILEEPEGFGLETRLRTLGSRLSGIRNGIDVATWNPATDGAIAARYNAALPRGKARCRAAQLAELGWVDDGTPLAAMVTRLADQKGVDLALAAVAATDGVRCALLGAGDPALARQARALAARLPERVAFREGYDGGYGHRLFAGADLLLMPSRFEPCGLAQMQAMAYGTVPVVTDVGGLHDTVRDADASPAEGTGFIAASVDAAGVTDALRRALAAWRDAPRWQALQRRGMTADWSWREPAAQYAALYASLLAARDGGG
jgi:starch synthase